MIRPLAALLSIACLVGCAKEEGREPLTEANKAAEVQNADLPIAERIQKIRDNPNMPEPEKERAIKLLEAQSGQR